MSSRVDLAGRWSPCVCIPHLNSGPAGTSLGYINTLTKALTTSGRAITRLSAMTPLDDFRCRDQACLGSATFVVTVGTTVPNILIQAHFAVSHGSRTPSTSLHPSRTGSLDASQGRDRKACLSSHHHLPSSQRGHYQRTQCNHLAQTASCCASCWAESSTVVPGGFVSSTSHE
jgi:hypothetical protein